FLDLFRLEAPFDGGVLAREPEHGPAGGDARRHRRPGQRESALQTALRDGTKLAEPIRIFYVFRGANVASADDAGRRAGSGYSASSKRRSTRSPSAFIAAASSLPPARTRSGVPSPAASSRRPRMLLPSTSSPSLVSVIFDSNPPAAWTSFAA